MRRPPSAPARGPPRRAAPRPNERRSREAMPAAAARLSAAAAGIIGAGGLGMTQQWVVGILASVMISASAAAQTAPQGQVPAGDSALGSVRIPRAVMADGKPLAAGTYQVRL